MESRNELYLSVPKLCTPLFQRRRLEDKFNGENEIIRVSYVVVLMLSRFISVYRYNNISSNISCVLILSVSHA